MPSGGTMWRWGCGIIAVLVLLSAIGAFTNYIGLWGQAAVTVISPENVKAQFQAAYDDINALNAVGQNICTLAKARDAEPNADLKSQRESQVLAQEQNFQRIQNHYNAYIHDAFRAKYVRPRDLPDPAPTEQSVTSQYCPNQNI